MNKNQLQDELLHIGMEFAIYHIGKLSYHCFPLIIEKNEKQKWNTGPGLYLYLGVMDSPEELEQLSKHEEFDTTYFIKIVRTSKGLELKGQDIELIKEHQGEKFTHYIEERFQKFKLRLLFLYPKVEEFI